MDCNHETYTIQVSSYGATSNVNFVSTLSMPIKNISKAQLVTTSMSCPSSNVAYIVVDELVSRFNDYSIEAPASNDSNTSLNLHTTSSRLRKAFGVVYNEDSTSRPRITYYNRYPIVADFFDPIKDLSKLSIQLYGHDGNLLVDSGLNFFTFRFTCLRKNLC